jgi:hypothetical protein
MAALDEANDLAVAEGELPTDEWPGAVHYVNGVEAQLTRTAANAIELHVRGADRLLGTADTTCVTRWPSSTPCRTSAPRR